MLIPNARAPLALALAAAAVTAGCAHQGCENVPDGPPPVATAPVCSGFLDAGQRCQVVVHPRRRASSTGLVVVKGQRYQVQVAPGQKWFDANLCYSPPEGGSRRGMVTALERWRQDDAPWFTLMAAVTRGQDGGRLGHGQALDANPVVEVQQTGVLALYPNDLPGFYWNNKGNILACIERLAPGAAPVSAPRAGEAFCPAQR